ncbi:MAG: AAA family ATPase [Nitrosopumilus sp.]|nr:AAA family ATPase [Nitrosopumilus sp.]
MYDIDPTPPENSNTNPNSEFENPSYGDNSNKNKIIRKINSVGNLPHELLKFVNNDTYSLLVKGKPGTGKTTFALTLMDNLNHNSNFFYISTRLSIKQLLYFYPWISKFNLKNESEYEYKFEDARLDEPESLFERITNQLMDVKSPIIMIDTWDAIASFMDRESRLNNERVLQIWRERAGAKLIFLSESYDVTLLDSIVDGVITLTNDFKKSTYSRELFINKLRGISIDCPRYYYSLFNGIFSVFNSLNDINIFEKVKLKKFYLNKLGFNKDRIFLKHCKSPKNQNTFLNDLLNNNKIVTMEFDPSIQNELILSIIIRPLFCRIISDSPVSVNNFQWNFYSLLKKFMLFFIQPEFLDKNLLNEQLDFSKLINNYKTIDEQNNIHKESKDNFENFETSLNKFISQISKNSSKKQKFNILNIMDGNNFDHLFSNFKFIEVLKRSSANNLVVLKNRPCMDIEVLLSESNYYKIILKGKNILIQSINSSRHTYGVLDEKDSLFVNWSPLF